MDGPANDLRRLCVLGMSLALAFSLSACGGSSSTADPDSALRVASADMTGASAQERACITRNRDVVPWNAAVMAETGWDTEHRQAAHRQVINAVHSRLGIYSKFRGLTDKDAYVMSGLLGYALDPVGSRLIMLLDPAIVDVPEFRRWVAKVARQANKDADVVGRPLTVTVQEGCFSAREIVAATSYVRENDVRLQSSMEASRVGLDGRLRMGFVDQAAVAEAQRQLGPVIAAEEWPIVCAATRCASKIAPTAGPGGGAPADRTSAP